MCHNPHTDVKPTDAHEVLRRRRVPCRIGGAVAFHAGSGAPQGGRSAARPATSRMRPGWTRATAPAATHRSARAEAELRPPLPFDTTKALQANLPAWWSPGRSRRGQRRRAAARRAGPATSIDTNRLPRRHLLPSNTSPPRLHHLPHAPRRRRSKLTFEPPRGCQICHHQRPHAATARPAISRPSCEPAHAVTVR